ncbi:stage II sporulation protein P [Paenibacillus sp. HB172176]|uniref:stage II sporulation protein P n=1 Tax=Paenibacillus sp. HB172176 TaxID=2493690 RepID=UPI001F0E07A2|nr:stage II sporulation protein P [Paenibacillus sp. HB172176]
MMNHNLRQTAVLGFETRIRQVLVTGRAFSVLSLSSMLFFLVLGAAVMIHSQSQRSPIYSMSGLASSMSSGFFGDMLEMEMPMFQSGLPSEALTSKEVSVFLMRTLTDMNPNNPKSLLAGELPGMSSGDSILIRKGIGTDADEGPQDHSPVQEPQVQGENGDGGDAPGQGSNPQDSHQGAGGAQNGDGGASGNEIAAVPTPTKKPDQGEASKPTTGDDKVVFIYHSHSRESWFPEIKSTSNDPSSATTNITLVGKRLADKLEEEGVGAMHSDTDYPSVIKGYRWELSYKYSLKSVQEAMASNKKLKFFFDIHRDSQKRKYTTVDIGGKSYAQVYFIIGHKNPDWKENEAFATQIHDALEERYPGISRGIWGKTAATGNGEYNQSLAADSVLIEIGGVDNTLEESYRTADALAEVISGIYWDAEKVSGEGEE